MRSLRFKTNAFLTLVTLGLLKKTPMAMAWGCLRERGVRGTDRREISSPLTELSSQSGHRSWEDEGIYIVAIYHQPFPSFAKHALFLPLMRIGRES